MLGRKLAKPVGQAERAECLRRADADGAGQAHFGIDTLRPDPQSCALDVLSSRQELLAFGGKVVAGWPPVEEPDAEGVLEPRDPAAERGVLYAHQPRRLRQPARPGDRQEGLQVVPPMLCSHVSIQDPSLCRN